MASNDLMFYDGRYLYLQLVGAGVIWAITSNGIYRQVPIEPFPTTVALHETLYPCRGP